MGSGQGTADPFHPGCRRRLNKEVISLCGESESEGTKLSLNFIFSSMKNFLETFSFLIVPDLLLQKLLIAV
jgi:hypothetical protein